VSELDPDLDDDTRVPAAPRLHRIEAVTPIGRQDDRAPGLAVRVRDGDLAAVDRYVAVGVPRLQDIEDRRLGDVARESLSLATSSSISTSAESMARSVTLIPHCQLVRAELD